MKSFSERHGHVPEREIQVDSMDADLKRRILDVIYEHLDSIPVKPVWTGWIKRGVAELEHLSGVPGWRSPSGQTEPRVWFDLTRNILLNKIKETEEHHEIYDLLEIIVQSMEESHIDPVYGTAKRSKSEFVGAMNGVLEENMSAWRIEGDMVVRAMADVEAGAVREAASISEENADYVRGAMRAMGASDPDFETCITLAAKTAEGTLDRIGSRGSGVGSKLDSIAGSLDLPVDIVKSFKRMNDFANEFARHPHSKETYRDDRNDAMLILVWCSAMSTYLHNRWRDRGGGK